MISASILTALIASGVSQVVAYNPSCGDNLVAYWGTSLSSSSTTVSGLTSYLGQNSGGGQQSLAAYCQDSTINAIPIAFVDVFESTGGLPEINLANTCGVFDGVFPGTSLANCQFLASDIEACQAAGKLVTISLGGGATSGSVSFTSDAQGTAFANTIWNLFLGGSSSTRPFGSAVLDGVDLDIEVGSPTGFAAFVNQIRALSAGASKKYFVTAAPQCPFPDAHIGAALNEANYDAIYIQFYNNPQCENDNPSGFNFGTWDNWAKTVSPNPNVKVFIGAPASPGAGNGYIDAGTLGALAVSTRSQFSSFGGVMLWDASAAFANGRYDQQVKSIINNNCAPSNATGTPPPSSCSKTYTVVSGDTCAVIESKTGVSDATLHSLNPSINSACSNLQVGQTLCISGSPTTPPSNCAQTYTVVSGDTCAAIESKTGISDATLHSLNPSINSACSNLQVGQVLCVSSGSTSCAQTYTVVSGDTCAVIESKTGISDATLHSLNPSINSACSNLQVGQTLCVSGSTPPPSSCSTTYTVVSGDTCAVIESKTGISDATLHSLNPSINSACSNLQVGETLCVSGGSSSCAQTYTVVSGDTCAVIESKNGISDSTLHSLNPSINSACSNLQVGQTLCVSGGSTTPPSSSCAVTYTVVSGDTCVVIESKTGVSDATLHSLNPSINSACSNLQVGQNLCVSGGSSSCPQKYTVASGDTCVVIESKFGISDATLHSLNPSINSACSNLQVGQTLCV